jgi:hypothetical protein
VVEFSCGARIGRPFVILACGGFWCSLIWFVSVGSRVEWSWLVDFRDFCFALFCDCWCVVCEFECEVMMLSEVVRPGVCVEGVQYHLHSMQQCFLRHFLSFRFFFERSPVTWIPCFQETSCSMVVPVAY